MATTRERGGSWNVYWRYGGRGGPTQSTTWPTQEYAEQAADIARRHHHRITAADVEAIILGEPIPSTADDQPNDNESSTPTVREWADIYLDHKTKISPGTKRRYRSQLDDVILPIIGHLHLDEVRGSHISALLNELGSCDCIDGTPGQRCSSKRHNGHGLSTATIDRYFTVVKALFGYAVRERHLTSNPAEDTDWTVGIIDHDDADEEGADHVYLSPEEYELIRSHAAPDAQPLLDYLIGTGARWSEATAASVDSIDPMARPRPIARIHRAWKHRGKGAADKWYLGPPKGRAKRTIEIGAVLTETLLPLIAGEPGDALLFRAPDGGRINHSNFSKRRWEPAVIAAMRCPLHPPAPASSMTTGEVAPRCGANGGIRSNGTPCGAKVVPGWDRCKDHRGVAPGAVSDCDCPTRLRKRPTIHDLRHSHASWLVAANEPLVAISIRLGHQSTAVTEKVYAGILHVVRASIVAALDAAMGQPRGAAASAAGTGVATARAVSAEPREGMRR